MPRKGCDQASISVSKKTGERIAAAAKKHGCSLADVVRAACADILEPPESPGADLPFPIG